VVGQRVVGEGAAGDDVRTHGMTASHVAVFGLPFGWRRRRRGSYPFPARKNFDDAGHTR